MQNTASAAPAPQPEQHRTQNMTCTKNTDATAKQYRFLTTEHINSRSVSRHTWNKSDPGYCANPFRPVSGLTSAYNLVRRRAPSHITDLAVLTQWLLPVSTRLPLRGQRWHCLPDRLTHQLPVSPLERMLLRHLKQGNSNENFLRKQAAGGNYHSMPFCAFTPLRKACSTS